MNPLMGMLRRLTPRAWWTPYEGANFNHRRSRVPGVPPTDTKRDLTPAVRAELVKRSRYLHKNSGFVRELVGNMAIYSTGDGIRPQAQSADPEWNKQAEEYFSRWAARCEITRRFSFEECQSLICRGMDVDGEYFVHKTRDAIGEPVLQLIETHRVGDGSDEPTPFRDGVGLDPYGAPSFYRVVQDEGSTRDIPAEAVLHVFEPESVSAVRHPPTIQHSINHILDEMELLALEKHAVKDNADIARVLKTERGEISEDGDFTLPVSPMAPEPSDPISLQAIIGGKVVALKPNENIESFESKRPSPTFTGFLEHLRRDAALGVLPFEFAADSSKVGGAGVRLIVAKADRRFSYRQLILIQRFLTPVWAYVIGDGVARGLLPTRVDWYRVRFQKPKKVTVDAGREAEQNRADVEAGLKTLSESYAELGLDFEEQAEIRAQDARLLMDLAVKYDVPIQLLYNPSSGGGGAPTSPDSSTSTPTD